jgi:hypothetical protein
MSGISLDIAVETFPFAAPFRISGYVFDRQDVVVVTLTDGDHVGRGEAPGVYYLGEDPARMTAQIEAQRALIESGVSREMLRGAMPAGGARNAVDAAMWDLEAKRRAGGLANSRPRRAETARDHLYPERRRSGSHGTQSDRFWRRSAHQDQTDWRTAARH